MTSIIPKNCPWIYSEFGIIFIINPLTSEEYLKFYNNSINKLNNELQKLGGMIENVPKHINEKIQTKIDTIKNNIYWHNYLKFRFKV